METLSTRNHFAQSFGPDIYYNAHFDFSDSIQKKSVESRSLSSAEKNHKKIRKISEDINIPPAAEPKVERDSINPSIYNFQEQTSFHRAHVPQVCEPPLAANSPSVFVPEQFECDLAAASDAEFGEREFFLRCVVIGAKNTGKHELINSSFPEDKCNATYQRGPVDFIKKTTLNCKTTRKYHFWLNTLGENSATKDAIWKTYYKFATAFVFVYDTTSKESFDALEKAVKNVLEVVPQENFFGILVGTKSDLYKQRAVGFEEAVQFKYRYNFKHFVETNSAQEKESRQVVLRLNTKLKCTFEEI